MSFLSSGLPPPSAPPVQNMNGPAIVEAGVLGAGMGVGVEPGPMSNDWMAAAATADDGDKKEVPDNDSKAPTLPAPTAPENPFIEHIVRPSDTLSGLQIRYGVSKRQIKRYNEFPGENFKMLKKLTIPAKPGSKAPPPRPDDLKLRDFAAEMHCSVAEAKFYLGEHGFDYDAAAAALKQDVAWEKLHGAARVTAPEALLATETVIATKSGPAPSGLRSRK